jgi:excisionase family DNA binding protein
MDPHIEKLLYSRQDAAVALSVSLRSIDYLISDGELTTRRIGRKTLIPVTEIRRFARGDHPEAIRKDARRAPQSQLTGSDS